MGSLCDDSESFAYKFMQKMGWREGKGLGKLEDGISTHIKVTKKSDNRGLGTVEEHRVMMDIGGNAGWTTTSLSFEEVLLNLNKTYKTSKGGNKKAKKSKKKTKSKVICPSRAKRVRSKDLKAFSENDLKSILGTDFNKRVKSSSDSKTASSSSDDDK
mmetsp:Transcript_1021/g.1543  ORF Transcript_1021/g.1543 Transcript_1021/m.1543 type:complete len:158 (-) Transcript_1021:11-484(-)